jgi:RNA polymerase sigma factor (sigma-70 family)
MAVREPFAQRGVDAHENSDPLRGPVGDAGLLAEPPLEGARAAAGMIPSADQGSVTQWLQDLRAGQSFATGQLWQRYYERLVRLAAHSLRNSPRRVADEEDVAIAAFASFCRGATEGRFPRLQDRDDLWQVLVMLTLRKAANQLKHDRRQKRGHEQVRGESVWKALGEDTAGIDSVVGREPTPEFALEVAEECERLLTGLGDDVLRRVAVAKMEGYTNGEIAAQLGVKLRTVERKLKLIRELWVEEQ